MSKSSLFLLQPVNHEMINHRQQQNSCKHETQTGRVHAEIGDKLWYRKKIDRFSSLFRLQMPSQREMFL